MAELEFIKGLYTEGQKKLDEATGIGRVLPVTTTAKAFDTLLKMTKDGGVMSKALRKEDSHFERELKVINRQVQRLSEVFDRLITDVEVAQEPVNMDYEGSPGE